MRTIPLVLFLGVLSIGCATYMQLYTNADHEVINCSATGQGAFGMATAADAVNTCKMQMRAAGFIEIERAGVIGVMLSASEPGDPVLIIKVTHPSPASEAGIQPGDIMVEISGIKITNVTDAKHLLFDEKNTPVTLVVTRGGQSITYDLIRESFSKIYGIAPPDGGSKSRPAGASESGYIDW